MLATQRPFVTICRFNYINNHCEYKREKEIKNRQKIPEERQGVVMPAAAFKKIAECFPFRDLQMKFRKLEREIREIPGRNSSHH